MQTNKGPLISVVLPVYNVEKYLRKCLDSVLGQTYKKLEVILVDDGSPDSSDQICEEYAKRDERVKVLHKENGGLSDARNCGIKIAGGEYITFIDSDDDISSTYIEYLYFLIQKYNTKMSLCTHTVVWENGKSKKIGDGTDEVLDSESCLERMLYHDIIDTSAWGKLYHRSLFENIMFPVGKLFEDIGTTYRFFLASGRIACGYESQYYYMIRKNSIVTGKFNEKKFDLMEMTDQMAVEVSRVYPKLKHAVLRRQVYARLSTLNQMLDITDYQKERQAICDFVMANAKDVLKNSKSPVRDKCAIILLRIGYPLYRLCWKIISK